MELSVKSVEYRDVPGFPGYRVGSDGSVWTCILRKGRGARNGWGSYLSDKWRVLKPRIRARHLAVNLRGRTMSVHVLVAAAFHGPRPKGHVVRHFPDRDYMNCRANNLRYGTHKENAEDKIAHGTEVIGEKKKCSKLTVKLVQQMRADYASGGVSYVQLGIRYGLSNVCVGRAIRRETWKHA